MKRSPVPPPVTCSCSPSRCGISSSATTKTCGTDCHDDFSGDCDVVRCSRRGTIVHNCLAYLSLSAVLLTTAGLSLQLLLRADLQDGRVAHRYRTLMRLEDFLRRDAAEQRAANLTSDLLLLRMDSEHSVRWSIEDNSITRSHHSPHQQTASERFVFSKGTSVAFTDAQPGLLLVTLSFPRLRRQHDGPVETVQLLLPLNTSADESPLPEQPDAGGSE